MFGWPTKEERAGMPLGELILKAYPAYLRTKLPPSNKDKLNSLCNSIARTIVYIEQGFTTEAIAEMLRSYINEYGWEESDIDAVRAILPKDQGRNPHTTI